MAVQPQPATEAAHGHAHAAAQDHAEAVCPTSAVQRNDGGRQFQVVLLSTLSTSLDTSFDAAFLVFGRCSIAANSLTRASQNVPLQTKRSYRVSNRVSHYAWTVQGWG